MLQADLADSALASEWPDMADACDTPADHLREALARFIPQHLQPAAFSAIDAVCSKTDLAGGAADRIQIERETLRKVFGDTRLAEDIRMQALSAAIASNDPLFGRAYQHYADDFAVTRACVHAKSRDVQKKFGLRARRDKKDDAREKSKANATGPRGERAPAKTSGILRGGKRRRIWSFFPGL